MNATTDKYCRCLMKVRPKAKGGPYGICTSSVLKKRGAKRPTKGCVYDFDEFRVTELRAYAKEKKIPRYGKLNKAELVRVLMEHQK
jgi:hypothetical protein